jgi:hypothetical protein
MSERTIVVRNAKVIESPFHSRFVIPFYFFTLSKLVLKKYNGMEQNSTCFYKKGCNYK